jgi:putative membrane protein
MMGCNGDMMGGWMWFGSLLWFALIAGGIALIVWVIARGAASGTRTAPPADDRALSTLRERFARGEIDEAEYRQRRQTLDAE